MQDRIKTTWKKEILNGSVRSSRLWVTVVVDGEEVGRDCILAGPTEDVDAFIAGEVTLDELRKRWGAHGIWI
jgi:hypothetical protein